MSNIALKDILIAARQESHRMRHFYLGTEHLLIALLTIKGGIMSSILSDSGLTPDYVIDAVRRKVAKGSRHRLWAGVPNTPRAEVVLGIAHELAQEQGRQHILERDLLMALLDEGDGLSVRVLEALGVNVEAMRQQAMTRDTPDVRQSFVTVDFAPDFEHELREDDLFILRQMFSSYGQIRLKACLRGGYSSALLLVVTPIQADKREDATVVVKINQTALILDEAQRYERFVKGTLPPLTARLEDTPTTSDSSDIAALKYTFVADAEGQPADLRRVAQHWTGKRLGGWLKERLFDVFGDNWWQQSRPYLFEAWQEYDWLLPPMLTLETQLDVHSSDAIQTLRHPVRRARIHQLAYGDTVMIENFVVQKVNHQKRTIRLALGQGGPTTRAFQIEVRGINFDEDTYYRGEIVEKLVGRVWQTRDEELRHVVRTLEPDFDVSSSHISLHQIRLPNPLFGYMDLLDATVNGTLSIIHGDLHLGNILIGAGDNALLIDFGLTREGHTLFDWATLEVSLLAEVIVPMVGEGWEGVREIADYLVALNNPDRRLSAPPTISEALEAIRSLRGIVQLCLAQAEQWDEYFLSLALLSMRAMLWKTMSLDKRRLMFVVSALAMHEYHERQRGVVSETLNTPSPDDETDYFS